MDEADTVLDTHEDLDAYGYGHRVNFCLNAAIRASVVDRKDYQYCDGLHVGRVLMLPRGYAFAKTRRSHQTGRREVTIDGRILWSRST